MNICTVIPARGGSKSIKKKNIQPLIGKPLLKYSIDYSLSCKLVSVTFVSTDSREIQTIAKECGAFAEFLRPAELATDGSRDYPFMRHALQTLEDYFDQVFDALVLLRPTSPLRPNGLIERATKLLQENPHGSSVRSIAKTDKHPYRHWFFDGLTIRSPFKEMHNEQEPYNVPRQELPDCYFQTGDLEMVRRDTLLTGSVSGEHVLGLTIDESEYIDIDTIDDLERAKQKIEKN